MFKQLLKKIFTGSLILTVSLSALTGCGNDTVYDDIATNDGYEVTESDSSDTTSHSYVGTAIPKEDIKVGIIHLTDPADRKSVV